MKVGGAVVGTWAPPRDWLALMRKLEVEGLLSQRRGEGRVGEAEEEAFLFVIAPALVALAEPGREAGMVAAWIRRKCPKLCARRGERWVHARAADAKAARFVGAQIAGNVLVLTETERRVRGITTMRPAGWTEERFNAHRRTARAAWARRDRQEKGATPRALSIAALAPWKREGIARSEWYARHSPEERQAIVERLRGRFRGRPLPCQGASVSRAVNETVHDEVAGTRTAADGSARRVVGGAPEGAPATPPSIVERAVRGVRRPPALAERTSRDPLDLAPGLPPPGIEFHTLPSRFSHALTLCSGPLPPPQSLTLASRGSHGMEARHG